MMTNAVPAATLSDDQIEEARNELTEEIKHHFEWLRQNGRADAAPRSVYEASLAVFAFVENESAQSSRGPLTDAQVKSSWDSPLRR
jgi:uncharacterized phage protein gp47/JayE